MSEADSLRQQIANTMDTMRLAVGNGASAMEEVNHAVGFLNQAWDYLKGSRVFALQELETIKLMLSQMNLMLSTSMDTDILSAIGELDSARQDVENYVNRIEHKIRDIETLTTVIELARRDQELDAAGVKLRNVADTIYRYGDRL